MEDDVVGWMGVVEECDVVVWSVIVYVMCYWYYGCDVRVSWDEEIFFVWMVGIGEII